MATNGPRTPYYQNMKFDHERRSHIFWVVVVILCLAGPMLVGGLWEASFAKIREEAAAARQQVGDAINYEMHRHVPGN